MSPWVLDFLPLLICLLTSLLKLLKCIGSYHHNSFASFGNQTQSKPFGISYFKATFLEWSPKINTLSLPKTWIASLSPFSISVEPNSAFYGLVRVFSLSKIIKSKPSFLILSKASWPISSTIILGFRAWIFFLAYPFKNYK